MNGFIGRRAELGLLDDLLAPVRTGGRSGRPGRAVLLRGRRRVGKSRLVEEFLERAGLPHVFFTAVGGSKEEDLAGFAAEVAASTLPDAARFADFTAPQTWDGALSLLAGALPMDRPSVVVLDEMPYLVREDPSFEGALQKVFDRTLCKLPVLLILVGSDIAMMEKLNTYGRPFYQRGTDMVVPPLSPADVAAMLSLPAADAFDAYLVSGGLPLILDEWPHGADLWEYLASALRRPTSALLVSGERTLAAEFPTETQARTVLGAIGHGERTFTLIGRAAGGLNPGSVARSLELLTTRRMVAAELPLSTRPSRETRYRIDDPYLRFWLSFIGPGIPAVERGRGDRVLESIRTSWTAWRGRAIEPVIREALWRLADDRLPVDSNAIGGYWTRTNDPEIDIIAADRSPIAKKITLIGSIKWLESKPFDTRDLARLITHRSQHPGADDTTPLLAIARNGCTASGIPSLTPEDLLAAWT
ncbi:AAA+ ATPase superfamily predicted ATPase [Streptomyces sp. LBL]|uniref:ATP-binding protein n=1 Tax=Streptomyces sp. LBL TaxID=2940562 RepID=UPI002475BB2B|nr:ATP-binding protein [Streptomyces sp. LBL]MDH6627484.1 AAA+ ATPase superfamily predicted ATPase [Streptomyces sp. LBL]